MYPYYSEKVGTVLKLIFLGNGCQGLGQRKSTQVSDTKTWRGQQYTIYHISVTYYLRLRIDIDVYYIHLSFILLTDKGQTGCLDNIYLLGKYLHEY